MTNPPLAKPKVLLIAPVWPEPRSSAAGLREESVIRMVLEAGWEISYASTSRESDHSAALRARGVPTYCVAPNDPGFDSLIAGLAPDYVIFDRFITEEQFGWRVKETVPSAVRVLDTIELHFLRRARERALREGKGLEAAFSTDLGALLPPGSEALEDAHREIASIFRSDLSLLISPVEKELLIRQAGVPEGLLEVLSFCYPEPPPAAPFERRRDFMIIGNFRHPPNADAVLWLHREIWPLIRRELPEAELHVHGAYPPREMMALDDARAGFRVLGPAEDSCEAMMRHRVNLAPQRFGAGIKGKIADGWWSGTPTVSTPVGAEGMGGAADWLAAGRPLVRRSADEIAATAVALHQEPAFWQSAQLAGLAALRREMSASTNARPFIEALERARALRDARRAANLVGGMLWHHLHRSTTYFSRWIELKNAARAP